MYEVVRVEKSSSSAPNPTKKKKKVVTIERISQTIFTTSDSFQMHLKRVS